MLSKDDYFEKFNRYRSTDLGKGIRIFTHFIFSYFFLPTIVEIRKKENTKKSMYYIKYFRITLKHVYTVSSVTNLYDGLYRERMQG